ncbi:hypothetical protein CXG81DRAFT_9112 [Caulochytrium protostelioides]|uniref:chitin synthase n=1 Tax=Caulochytrium protostelioides TaxID=1555241 RepID=A0A4P9XE40_9FUNG|nr:hypothetical protein CXG81DRAFT_9112 [Caulochytrium protostelioides]|eukprot:RKP03804.1 hypothetical protein CXG81DRAFT_9112 [Caulochytrium protostelioides]
MAHVDAVTDLAAASNGVQLTDPETLAGLLVDRAAARDQIYTRVGASGLLAVHPGRPLHPDVMADQTSKAFAAHFHSLRAGHRAAAGESGSQAPIPHPDELAAHADALAGAPHVFGLGLQAYATMRRTEQDQSIVLMGSEASGKSTSHALLTRLWTDVSRGPGIAHKKTKLQSVMMKTQGLLSAFGGNSATRYTEYQFSDDGRLVGMKVISYLLERPRLAGVGSGIAALADAHGPFCTPGHAYDILFMLVEGASSKERKEWGLTDIAHFDYLTPNLPSGAKHRRHRQRGEDAEQFQTIKDALTAVHINSRVQRQLFQVLAAILHLGNLDFSATTTSDARRCRVSHSKRLDQVALLLGISPAALEDCLTHRSRQVGYDFISQELDLDGCRRQRDAFARGLYDVVYEWIIEQINAYTCRDDPLWANFIAVLDVPGYLDHANTQPVGLYTFLRHWQHERLAAFVGGTLLDGAADNSAVLEVLDGLHSGILSLLDREARRQTPSVTRLARALQDQHSADSADRFSIDMHRLTMTIAHSFGTPVTYHLADLLYRTASDRLQSDFVTLVRGNRDAPGTSNVFLRRLFSDRVVDEMIAPRASAADGSLGRQRRTLVSSLCKRQPSLKRRKSERRVNAAAGGFSSGGGGGGGDSSADGMDGADAPGAAAGVAAVFRHQFSTLLETLADTRPWAVWHLMARPGGAAASAQATATVTRAVACGALLRQITPAVARAWTHSASPCVWLAPDLVSAAYAMVPNDVINLLASDTHRHAPEDARLAASGSLGVTPRGFWRLEATLPLANEAAAAAAAQIAAEEEAYERAAAAHEDSVLHSQYGDDAFDEEDHAALAYSTVDGGVGRRTTGFSQQTGGASQMPLHQPIELSHFRHDMDATAKKNLEADAGNVRAAAPGDKMGKKKSLGAAQRLLKETSRSRRPMTSSRRKWACCTTALTWWVPDFVLRSCCGMKLADRRQAWREKVAICILIAFSNAAILFVIVGLGFITCPNRFVYSTGEISGRNKLNGRNQAMVALYGNYYSIKPIAQQHMRDYGDSQAFWEQAVLGNDVSQMFPLDYDADIWDANCPNLPKPATFQQFPQIDSRLNTGKWVPHTKTTVPNQDFFKQIAAYRKGQVVWHQDVITEAMGKGGTVYLRAYDRVYDISSFYTEPYYTSQNPQNFFDGAGSQRFRSVFDNARLSPGADMTEALREIRSQDETAWANAITCLDNVFVVGYVDHRKDASCQVPNYILLVASVMLVLVIGVKFLAALQFGSSTNPENHDKFVICQVPCYTEGETSLQRAIESIANTQYDDKHKLLFVICDGMIIGSGNDRPTPRIVLDILGVDPAYDPPSLAFQSTGEGSKQLNMAKVYSGLFEHQGHVVPYMVVVKVGKASERARPGNRGKRDSQLLLMRFLNRVHFNAPMAPLELEMYHQFKNVIGVDPNFYEYVLMIDADTEVAPPSLNGLVSHMVRDSQIAGICGETGLSNENASLVSMNQVFEYYISQNMAKAFESLFGTVTCLPGCFSLYRIRTPVKNVPVLVAPNLIQDYAENQVDTLHLKNLLHLGEDRYLTTLLLKHFPGMKTKFTPDAMAKTVAPDKWNVLISQRRRWINSTIHNLVELMRLPDLCGFCLFSMRFVVFVDFLATLIQPASLIYIVYLIISVAVGMTTQFPLISLIMLAAIYGFQIIMFLIRREWQHVGWMIMYMIAIPVFGFFLPIYSIAKMDDFGWGSTRKVLGEDGKIVETVEEETTPAADEDFSLSEHLPLANGGPSAAASHYAVSPPARPLSHRHSMASVPGMPGMGIAAPPATMSMGGGGMNMGMGMPMGLPVGSTVGGPMGSAEGGPAMVSPMGSPLGMRTELPNHATTPVMPTDPQLLDEIRHQLSQANLQVVTLKTIRQDLEAFFGVDLTHKKAFINESVNAILQGQL